MYQTPCRTTFAGWVWDEGDPLSSEVGPPNSASLLFKSSKWAVTICLKALGGVLATGTPSFFSSAWLSSEDVIFFTCLRCRDWALPKGWAWAGSLHPLRIANKLRAQQTAASSLLFLHNHNVNADPGSLLFPTSLSPSRMDIPKSRMQSWDGLSTHAQGWPSGLSLNQGSRNKLGFPRAPDQKSCKSQSCPQLEGSDANPCGLDTHEPQTSWDQWDDRSISNLKKGRGWLALLEDSRLSCSTKISQEQPD